MVGNDIVDISLAKKQRSWQRVGFLGKVFTSDELVMIANAEDTVQMIWTLWSMKESVYKILIQQGHQRFFNPLKLKCMVSSSRHGSVTAFSQVFITQTRQMADYIFTIACTEEDLMSSRLSDVFLVSTNASIQSKYTHDRCLYKIAADKDWDLSLLEIRKTEKGVPKIYYHDNLSLISISLTHHGHFGAYTYMDDQN